MFTAPCSFLENAARSKRIFSPGLCTKYLHCGNFSQTAMMGFTFIVIFTTKLCVCVYVCTQVCMLLWYKELVLLMVIKSYKHTLTEH